jgi:hypothetical protein
MKAGNTRQSSSNNIGHRPGTGNRGTEDVLPSNKKHNRGSTAMNTRWAILFFSCALLAGEGAAASDKANIVRDLAGRVGPIVGAALELDTEKLIDVLENMRDLDLGLGTQLSFGRAEHQASHKIWGTALDETGKYQAIELE